MGIPYLVFLIALIPTGLAYYRVATNARIENRERFEQVTNERAAAIRDRVNQYVDELLALRGLFNASEEVSLAEWQRYLESVGIRQRFPGILLMGYLPRVSAAEKEAFVRRVREQEQGLPWFNVLPEGDRPECFPALYLQSFDTQFGGMVGRDHYSVPERRAVLDQARDTGWPQATGMVPLLEDEGFSTIGAVVIYLPVFSGLPSPITPQERRDTLKGYVFSAFVPAKLVAALDVGQSEREYDVLVHDTGTPGERRLLFGNETVNAGAAAVSRSVEIPVLNRTWTVEFQAGPGFAAQGSNYLPVMVLVGGLTISFLLFGLTTILVRARARAESMSADLKRQEMALADEKERLAVTLHSIADCVVTIDVRCRILSINKAAEKFTAWTQEEAVGKPLGEVVRIIDEKTREPVIKSVQELMRAGSLAGEDTAAILVGRDRRERVVSDSASPIRDRDGSLIGAVLVIRDITTQHKSEAEMLKESKLESVGMLAGGIAHDFNNILTGILGNLTLIRMSAHSTDKLVERLEAAEKSVLRAKDLTQQLLTFAKGGDPIKKPLRLGGLVKESTQFVLHGANVQAEFNLAENLWPVAVDEGQIRQIIQNLVINAVQAMPNGGKIAVSIANIELPDRFLAPLPKGSYVKIAVQDHGVGIHPENLIRIFDPYFSTKKNGSGLGLATAYSVIRKHGGQIRVDSTVGEGATFEIYLPAYLRGNAATEPEPVQKRFFNAKRILVMDDEQEILMVLGAMLEINGYESETARDGAEAIEKYMTAKEAGKPFDAVIMDLTIPNGMGGREAIRRLRELDPEVRAIVSSGYSYDPVMANHREFGFSGIMPKPYNMDDLKRVLSEVLGRGAEISLGM